MKIGIIVGHTKRSSGAFSKTLNQSEYVFNSGLAALMADYARSRGHMSVIETRDIGGIEGAFSRILKTNPSCVIELHFNAANGKASGSEVLFTDASDMPGILELALAQAIVKNMSATLGIPNRGVKELATGGERGFHNLAQTTRVASVLIESGFGDNPTDASRMRDRKQKLAETIVDAAISWKLAQS